MGHMNLSGFSWPSCKQGFKLCAGICAGLRKNSAPTQKGRSDIVNDKRCSDAGVVAGLKVLIPFLFQKGLTKSYLQILKVTQRNQDETQRLFSYAYSFPHSFGLNAS